MGDNSIYQDLSKFKLPKNFRGKPAIIVQFWWIIQSTLFSWSPQFMYGWRRFLLRLFGAKIGKKVIIRPSVKTTYPWNLRIGDYSWIGDNVVLYSVGEIKIGRNTVISQKSYICAASHEYRKLTFNIIKAPISIEDEVWISTDVFISPGINIKKGAVIGARSSVFSDVGAGEIQYGNPSRYIKPREIKK